MTDKPNDQAQFLDTLTKAVRPMAAQHWDREFTITGRIKHRMHLLVCKECRKLQRQRDSKP